VPPLPELNDPLLFLEVHDAVDETATLSEPQHYDYKKFRKLLIEPFNHLARRGDKLLGLKCLDIISEFFGADNYMLIHKVYERTVSNDTWADFARVYRLDAFVGVKKEKGDKFLADVWEAYWGALFLERQLWNEGDEDLVAVLRVMVFLRNETAIKCLGAYPFIVFDPTMQTDNFHSQDDDDIDVQEVLTFDGLSYDGVNPPPLGYRAQYKSTSNQHRPQLNPSFFSGIKETAISKLIWHYAVPWSTLTSSCSPFPSLFV